MKIEHLKINNFLGIRNLDAPLETPVVLVAGANGSGKSSVIDSLNFLITDKPGRVKLKKEFASLLPPGAKKGSVGATIDGRDYTRYVKSGNPATVAPPVPDALPYVLNAGQFAQLSDKDRRRFLMELMAVKADRKKITKELERRGHDKEKIDMVLPLLRMAE